MDKEYIQRKKLLGNLLMENNLDIILLYSTRDDSRYSKWISGVSCTSTLHYYFLSKKRSGFLEISYRANDLRRKTNDEVLEFEEEDTVHRDLEFFLQDYKRVGIVGNAPFHHLLNLTCEIVDMTDKVDLFLMKKSADEIVEIRKNGSILSNSLHKLEKQMRPGMTEIELSKRLRGFLLEEGEDLSFPMTVISGERLKESTVGTPSERKIKEQDTICIDVGIYRSGFDSDYTRMLFVGNDKRKDLYNTFTAVHHEVIHELKSGDKLGKIVEQYKEKFNKYGLPSETLTVQDIGHGVGYALHELPFIYKDIYSEVILEEGMVFTLEPEIFVDGAYLRIEDMLAVVDGKLEILTK